MNYTDAEEVAKTLQGILGIEAEGARAVRPGSPVAGPIAEPPFSQLYGPPQPPPPPGAPEGDAKRAAADLTARLRAAVEAL